MTAQNLIPGSKFRLYRENDTTANQFDFVCIATTLSLDRGKEFEDATVPDCDTPDAVPQRRSTVKSRSWDVPFSGKCDAVRFQKIEADFNADTTHRYQLLTALTGTNGGQTYTGAAYMGPITMAKSDNGMVSFTASLRGDGPLTTAAVTP